MSKVVGFVYEQKIYDDNLHLAKWEQNISYVPVRYPVNDLVEPHCNYCGSRVNGNECKSCGAPAE